MLWTSPSGHTWIVRAPSLAEPDLGLDIAPEPEPDPVHAPDRGADPVPDPLVTT